MKILHFKLLLITLFLLVGGISTNAQSSRKFSVASFELDPMALTAKNELYKKVDGNGRLFAIIKVTSNNPDDKLDEYHFDFGHLRHEVVDKEGELWLYVQSNAKMVTITRKGFAPIRRYDLHTTIESGKTYEMQLSVTAAPVYTQMVQFNVKPVNAGAVIMVRSSKSDAVEELFDKVDETTGIAAKSMEYGTYTYKIVANNYHISEGRIVLNDKSKTYIEDIQLRPNFSEINLCVNSDADIYINDERKGHRNWTGILRSGNYQVECRQPNHRNSSQVITITENNNRTIELNPPTPITGTLALVSKPYGATIMVDGIEYGVTPQNINDLIIGQHVVTLSKTNYKSESQTFEIRENQTTNLNVVLNDIAKMTITSNPSYSELYIDGKKVGMTPYSAEFASGDYKIKMIHPKYQEFEKVVHLSSSHPEVVLSLNRQFQQPSSGYIHFFGQAGMMMGVGGNIGGYISNFNAEVYATTTIGKEKLFINYLDGSSSFAEEFSGFLVGGKIGYGIIIGSRLRITPQLGIGSLSVKGDRITTNVLCGSASVRIDYALTSFMGVNITPEGNYAISKKDMFDILSTASSKIKGWGTGANCRLGLYFYL